MVDNKQRLRQRFLEKRNWIRQRITTCIAGYCNPNASRSVASVGALWRRSMQNEEHALPVQPSQPASFGRRRLITSLVLGGVSLAGIGSCIVTLGRQNPPSTKPHTLPVDTH